MQTVLGANGQIAEELTREFRGLTRDIRLVTGGHHRDPRLTSFFRAPSAPDNPPAPTAAGHSLEHIESRAA
ncbi:hypothetical protein AB0I49_13780 [Streptomyces sp. NPDC050617]|uniref:hypothetical protein n=1 Tax=Streptomyces sp. NPDC050617 TaxID=3154628 RepID=UPI003425DD24